MRRDIVSASSKGKLRAQSTGKVTITATIGNGRLTCKVTIKAHYKNTVVALTCSRKGYTYHQNLDEPKKSYKDTWKVALGYK